MTSLLVLNSGTSFFLLRDIATRFVPLLLHFSIAFVLGSVYSDSTVTCNHTAIHDIFNWHKYDEALWDTYNV